MSKQSYKICCCFSRIFKLRVSEPPEEIKALFDKYSENGYMTVDQLQRFLIQCQGEKNVSKEDAQKIIDDLKHLHNIFHKKGLHLDAFFKFLFGDSNSPLSAQVHHDMNAPLSHYYIYTGHNSYLTGNQLSSDCSDVPIIKALQRGVRVIELDLWPNSSKDNIDVVHGRTLTSGITLIKCLRSIKQHAFSVSPYPVVLTLEDHLTPNLQTKVAEMLNQTFGDMLFMPGQEGPKEHHSPESLKYKILVSTKPPKPIHEGEGKVSKEMEMSSGVEKYNEAWGEEVPNLEGGSSKSHQEDDKDSDDEGEWKLQQTEPPKYEALIAIHGRKRKGGMDEILRIAPDNVCRVSLNELHLKRAAETHNTHIIRFTQRNFLRVFPKTTRITSSNYNPLMGWIHGAQMVALNMQGYDRPLWLMHGMFRANGGCGYVKKPDFLLKADDPYHHLHHFKEGVQVKKTLKVKVYMGEGWHLDFHHTHFDMFSPPDFYVRIGIAGVQKDTVMKQTQTIEDDWAPVWNEEFAFKLTVPELALLQIEVHEFDPVASKDDFGGQTCFPVSEIKTGIRSVPLYCHKGEKFKHVKLLMRFEFV